MAKDQEEIEDVDLDKEDNNDDQDEKDAAQDDEASDDKKEDKDDSKEDDESEDDDSEKKDDSDEDDSKPLTRGDLKKILAARSKNRNSAAARVSQKRDLSDARKGNERVDSLEKTTQQLVRNEEKRQFGYANDLSPDEVDVVFRLERKPSSKSLKDPVIQGALKGYRDAKKAKANIPSSGGGRPNRPSDRSSKEDKNLSAGERRERFASRREEILSNKRGGRG